jgi:cytochrome P450
MSKLSGQSRAAIVSGFMDEIEPVIRGQVEAFQKIAARPEESRQLIEEYANQATATIAQALLDLDKPKQPRKRKGANGPP